jgi:hypothetical protein
MMRINLATPYEAKSNITFSIKWWYNINNYQLEGGRSGYELFEKEGNKPYMLIAQFLSSRMAVYNDVEGWQNMQFWEVENLLYLWKYDVNSTKCLLTTLWKRLELTNRADVFTSAQVKIQLAQKRAFDKPVVIVTLKKRRKQQKKVFY